MGIQLTQTQFSPILNWEKSKLGLPCCREQRQRWLLRADGDEPPGMWMLLAERSDPPRSNLWIVAATSRQAFYRCHDNLGATSCVEGDYFI